ncbi:MAG: type II secretion protein ATPase [Bdellovibrionales bacterium]
MSDTSTLLPISSVGVFVQNKQLQKSLESVGNDWRFPRVQIDIVDGDVEDAISRYKSEETHDLIIIETLSIDDNFSDRLGALSEHCTEDTAAIIVGPENDVNLYRKLMSMGISDYLVHPIDQEALADVIAKALIERLGTAKSRLVTVMGAKGGVGTSSVAQALALGCSETLKQKTLLFDAAGGASYASVALGQEPITTLKEASRAALADDEGSMKRMLVDVDDHLSLLASGGEPLLEEPVQLEGFDNILNSVMTTYPVVIFDASNTSVPIQRSALSQSHKIYILTTPTLSSLRTARTLIQEIKTLRGGDDEKNVIHLVMNMKGQFSGQEISKGEAEKALEHDIDIVLDFDPKLFPAAEIDGQKITQIKGSEKIVEDLLKDMEALVGSKKSNTEDSNKKSGLLDGLLEKLKG